MARLRVTRSAGSPAFFERLLSAGEARPAALSGLKKVYAGGAPVFPKLLRQLQHASPGAEVEAVYGSTEAEPIAHLETRQMETADHDAMRRGAGLLAGKPIQEIQLRVICDQWGTPLGKLSADGFAARFQPAGEAGEIVVTGDHVLKSYLHKRGDEETKFSVEGEIWHRTGDAGKLDEGGRLWLLGRCAARVEGERGRLYPFAVECVAQEHPGVNRTAFVEHKGRRCLAIETSGEFNEADADALRASLIWAGIERVLPVKRLPVDGRHNAKIDYPALRRLLAKSEE
jgi:acyl-CoA synthetase (AMP-forming)/AMP-acid ligase II